MCKAKFASGTELSDDNQRQKLIEAHPFVLSFKHYDVLPRCSTQTVVSNFRSWHGTDLHGRYARPKLLLSRDINAAINFTYRRLSSCWEKLVDGGLITDFIENREQGRESFPGL